MTENSIPHLLKLAGAAPSDKTAAAWLSDAIAGARHSHGAATERPLPADHNDLLADIEKSARELTRSPRASHGAVVDGANSQSASSVGSTDASCELASPFPRHRTPQRIDPQPPL